MVMLVYCFGQEQDKTDQIPTKFGVDTHVSQKMIPNFSDSLTFSHKFTVHDPQRIALLVTHKNHTQEFPVCATLTGQP